MKPRTLRRFVSVVVLLLVIGANVAFNSPSALADIYRWDNGELITTKDAVPRADLMHMDLSYADLVGADLARVHGEFARLNFADLTGANLADAHLPSTWLNSADFSNANLAGAEITNSWAPSANFTQANLTGASFFNGSDLPNASFIGANLSATNFRGADLTSADFTGAQLVGANLESAHLHLADFSAAIITGTDFSNTGRWPGGFTAEQFYSTASYQQGELRGVVLRDNPLVGWDFAGKDLTDASFSSANLTAADFTGANLARANFNKASLPLYLPMLPVVDSSARYSEQPVMITDPAFTTDAIIIYAGGILEIAPSEFALDCDVVFQLDDSGSGVIEGDGDIILQPDSKLGLLAVGDAPFVRGTYTLIEVQGTISGTFGSFSELGAYATEEDLIYTDTALTLQIDADLMPADANLDMATDLSDFNIWNANKFTTDTGWTTGDFNGDGVTDLSDFNIWNANKFTAVDGGAAPVPMEVPEPGVLVLLGLAVVIALGVRIWVTL